LIPFTTTISEENQDKHLVEKLRGEASGILNWLLEGFERWSEKGLIAPATVTSATDEYRTEMDITFNK
jgi:putative DNA primase/helicase